MYKIILLFILTSSTVHAMDLKFRDQKRNYDFKIDEYGVSFKSQFAEYFIFSTDCNQKYIFQLKKRIKAQLRLRTVATDSKSFQLKYNNKSIRLSKSSPTGSFFYNLKRHV